MRLKGEILRVDRKTGQVLFYARRRARWLPAGEVEALDRMTGQPAALRPGRVVLRLPGWLVKKEFSQGQAKTKSPPSPPVSKEGEERAVGPLFTEK